jgi:hypothetical protein
MKFLLKKERVFFFRGSDLQVFGQCGGAGSGSQAKSGGGWREKTFCLRAKKKLQEI